MKKVVLGLTVAAGIAFMVYAECSDKIVNSTTDDANNNSACSSGQSNSACVYHVNSPAVPECVTATNDTGSVCTSTNNVTYTLTPYNGKCDGYGTCHLGTKSEDPVTTNTVAAYYLDTCGG